MAKNTMKRKSFFKSIFEFLLGFIIGTILIIGGFKITFQFVNEETQNEMIAFEETVTSTFHELLEETKNFFYQFKKVENSEEKITFDGVKLSEVVSLNINNYIDFTIPYTWIFGKIEVEDAATEETIVITGHNVVMSVSLRNVEMKTDAESLRWSKEALLYELKNTYPDYFFTKSTLFEEKAVVVEGTAETGDTKLYITIIPVADKSIFVSYSFLEDDWNAELYFSVAISEMLGEE